MFSVSPYADQAVRRSYRSVPPDRSDWSVPHVAAPWRQAAARLLVRDRQRAGRHRAAGPAVIVASARRLAAVRLARVDGRILLAPGRAERAAGVGDRLDGRRPARPVVADRRQPPDPEPDGQPARQQLGERSRMVRRAARRRSSCDGRDAGRRPARRAWSRTYSVHCAGVIAGDLRLEERRARPTDRHDRRRRERSREHDDQADAFPRPRTAWSRRRPAGPCATAVSCDDLAPRRIDDVAADRPSWYCHGGTSSASRRLRRPGVSCGRAAPPCSTGQTSVVSAVDPDPGYSATPRCAAPDPPIDAGAQAFAIAVTSTFCSRRLAAGHVLRSAGRPIVVAGPGHTTALPELGELALPADQLPVMRWTSIVGELPKPTRTCVDVVSAQRRRHDPADLRPGDRRQLDAGCGRSSRTRRRPAATSPRRRRTSTPPDVSASSASDVAT